MNAKAELPPPKFAVDGVNHAGAGAMNRVKFDLVQAFLQNQPP